MRGKCKRVVYAVSKSRNTFEGNNLEAMMTMYIQK